MNFGKNDLVKYNLSLLYRFIKLAVDKNQKFDRIPIPLWKILGGEQDFSSKTSYGDLFSTGEVSEMEELGVFNQSHIDYLLENLSKSGIESPERLIAFIKTFGEIEIHRKSLDENGLRYFMASSYFIHLGKPELISSRDCSWAYFSESQDYILDTLTKAVGGKICWKDARNMGLGFWISNANTLKQSFETIARNQYWGTDGVHDPVACSLYYFALKKKNVLLGLWKLASHHAEQSAMLKFLSNNFDDERWKNAALKNAFALLGKQRYEYAAAFFLLGNKLKDAVNVCLKQLEDPQLAICICRIYEGENGPILNEIIQTNLLPAACKAGDRWLSCILWSLIGNRSNAFYSLTVRIFLIL